MMQDAIREGKNQQDLLNKKEHPIAVLQRVNTFEEKVKKLQEELNLVQEDLKITQDKYLEYSEEEKQNAELEIQKALDISPTPTAVVTEVTDAPNVDKLISQLQELDSDISELKNKINATNEEHSPNVFKKLLDELSELTLKKESLKETLSNKELVNNYITENYQNSSYDELGNNVVKTL